MGQFSNLDAVDTVFFERELESVKSNSYNVIYPEYKATMLIPIATDAGPGAESIVYQQYDELGVAKVIANYADDLPRADVKGTEFSSPIRGIGNSYGYNVQEIRASRMAGKNLDQRKANAAHRANDITVNKIAWFARPADGVNAGLTGLIYNPNITSATAPTGVTTSNVRWIGASPKNSDEILSDLNALVDDTIELTKGQEIPDTVLMPIAQYTKISSTRMAAGTDTTILEYFKRNKPMVSTIEWVAEFKDVNPVPSTLAASNTDIAMSYTKNSDKLTLEIPQPYEQFPAQERNLELVVNVHSRCGGVIIYYPLGVQIMEGI